MFLAEEVGNDEISSDTGEAPALPGVDGLAGGLVGGNSNGDSADLLDIFNLDVAISEAEKLVAAAFGAGDDTLDQDLLGKTLVIVEGTVDAAIEVTVDVEEARFVAQELLIGAAGEVQLQAARPQCFEKSAGARDEVLLGRGAFGEVVEAVADFPVEAPQVEALVLKRIEGLAAIAADLIGKLDHLVDGLLPGKAADAVLDGRTELFHRLALIQTGEDLHHHGDHHLHPAGSDEGDGTVKIK